jgi:hypothetical protein
MKTFQKFTLLLITFSAICLSGFGQHAGLDTLRKKFDYYRHQSVQEKIYVHLDRHQYVTGETMWFKIYIVDGALHKPADLSKVCYVEIVDGDNQPQAQVKVKLNDGSGSGFLFVPATINSGNFTFRAYTNWMKNFSPDFFFHTTVSIINPFRVPDQELVNKNAQPDAQFFPEGGNLVSGIKSKIAYRVTNPSGKGIVFKGSLINQNNDTIVSFRPLKNGVGNFHLTPQPGEKYKAVIQDGAGKKFVYNLPAVLESGYTIELDGSNLHVRTNNSVARYFYVFVHTRQMITQAEVGSLTLGAAQVPIRTAQLPEGISHITLFDENLTPVCERLYFKKPTRKLDVAVTLDQTNYGLRRKVNLDLNIVAGSAPDANLSVAVYKVDSLAIPEHEGIADYFLLSSDLKGRVETPEYYLNSKDSIVQEATDNLMLTHGWRRFNWKNVLDKQINYPYLPEYRGHIVNATVKDLSGKLAPNVQTYLSAPSKVIRFYGARSAANGNANFETLNFYGSQKIVLQTNRLRDSLVTVEVVNPFSDQYAKTITEPFILSSSQEDALIAKTIGMQVQDIYHDARSSALVNPFKDTTAFYGKADETYLLDSYTRFPVMEEVMREYVPGVFVRKRRDGYHFLVLDLPKKALLKDDPMILLDGVPVFDADEIMALDPTKVRKLEVVTRQYHLGSMVFQGLVSYTTYKGDLGGFQLNPRVVSVNYDGLQINREFYTPLYDDKKQREVRIPDQRNLLFWAPEVKLKSGSKQLLSFYTSDVEGTFKIVVEGNSSTGLSGSASGTFNTKRLDY